jgi:hypothetical protein
VKAGNNIQDIYELTPMQEGIYFHYLYEDKTDAYFEQTAYYIVGEFNDTLIENTFAKLFERYDILRTAFIYEKVEKPLQVVLKERRIDFFYQDIQALESKDEFINNYKVKDRNKKFDLTNDPLLRLSVLRTGIREYVFIWSFHHIIMDGWCISILVNDFLKVYQVLLNNEKTNLPPATPFKNYIEWLSRQDKVTAKNHWRKYLAGYEDGFGLNKFKKHTSGSQYENKDLKFLIDVNTSSCLKQISSQNNVTLNTIIQAVWGILLCKYNNTKDLVFGTVVSGRPADIDDIEHLVGLFINTIPTRIRYNENTLFFELFKNNKKEVIERKT